ncbi:MAG TPA: hypothetical protein ENJ71_02430 [Epsilonproteobacteria bacterium]|nr:hypothetical protein [Campylobacterota bacterium]
MKRWIMIMMGVMTAVALSGCGGSSYDDGYDDGYSDGFYDGARVPVDGMTTLFLRDIDGFSAGGVHYTCVDPTGALSADAITAPNGEFSFYPGEQCTFDLIGFGGTPGDPLFVEDDIGQGKNNIAYVCQGGDAGLTGYNVDLGRDGFFNYLPDDICTFSF